MFHPFHLMLHGPYSLIGVIWFIFWLWMLIDAVSNPSLDTTAKIVWFLVILLIPCAGAIAYLLVGRRRRAM